MILIGRKPEFWMLGKRKEENSYWPAKFREISFNKF